MRIIVAGSRSIKNAQPIRQILDGFKKKFTYLVSGMAAGVDLIGVVWAEDNDIVVIDYPADWYSIKPGDIVKLTTNGKPYSLNAGYRRNKLMAENADALIAFWNGKSGGTDNMIYEARKAKLKRKIFVLKGDDYEVQAL